MSGNTQLSSLEIFLESYPTVKYIQPSSPDYSSARTIFISSNRDTPLAIVQPQSPSDVAALVKYAKSQSIPFTLRCGGHNLEGRSVAQGALLIDLRALTDVSISPDRKSATVQGGIILEELGTKLSAEGLCTPIGATPTVGYVGWALYGGYGSFSSKWGLGVDQILGATVINPDGEIITADESLLEGIRGAGGLFGVIIDLTIKVYPFASVRESDLL
jgi:FAD/FMN-containing dehydrogenase